jgi:hypothetical protein
MSFHSPELIMSSILKFNRFSAAPLPPAEGVIRVTSDVINDIFFAASQVRPPVMIAGQSKRGALGVFGGGLGKATKKAGPIIGRSGGLLKSRMGQEDSVVCSV